MSSIVRVFEGKDLVIPYTALEELGVKPGDLLQIEPVPQLRPNVSVEERERRLALLEEVWGSWDSEDEQAFETARQEMWQQWQLPNSL